MTMKALTEETGRCDPATGLSGLLGPLGEKAFLSNHLGIEPLLVRGSGSRFQDVFDWAALNEILAAVRADAARIHLVRAAQGVSLASCVEMVPQLAPRGRPNRLRPDLLQHALDDGATLVVDGAEELHPPLRGLVTEIERSLGTLVQANLYVNLGGAAPGFHTHWDDHDVLVLQVEGAKHWTIHAPTQDFPVGRLSDPTPPAADTPAYWSGELTQGDVLSLPRGWWHHVEAVPGSPSAHLTLSARLPSAGDLLRRLLTHVATHETAARRDLPRFADPATAERWYEHLRTALVEVVREPGLLEKLAAELDGGAPARPRFGLPNGPDPDS
ncbi:JmjC domain-containing protein [Micromonosporaceae bacterium Da 78-11]